MKIYGKVERELIKREKLSVSFPSSYITLSHSPYTLKLYAKEVFIS